MKTQRYVIKSLPTVNGIKWGIWDKSPDIRADADRWARVADNSKRMAVGIARKLNAKEERKAEAERARIAAEKAQKPVSRLIVTIEWKKSRMWGMCPRASGRIEYKDGTWGHTQEAYASGCGYDKASTVVATVMGECLRYRLWKLTAAKMKATPPPYGMGIRPNNRWFEGGVGMSCYSSIAEYLGGKMDHVANTPSSDVYVFTFKR